MFVERIIGISVEFSFVVSVSGIINRKYTVCTWGKEKIIKVLESRTRLLCRYDKYNYNL